MTAIGPVGHVYPPAALLPEQLDRLARQLVAHHVPAVLAAAPHQTVQAWTLEGCFQLPQDAAKVLGSDHPFLAEATKDLIQLCHHPNAGALVMFGWSTGCEPITFPSECGLHAGFGPEETRAFALLPIDTPLASRTHPYVRPLDLREAANRVLGHAEYPVVAPPARTVRTLRVMTYNIHRCIGLDGRISPQRIARLIARYEPDVVALQEVDVGLIRTSGVNQAEVVAQALRMTHHFQPVISLAEGHYGNATLSCHPMRLVRAARVPQWMHWNSWEPRGALWVVLDIDGRPVHLIFR